MVGSRVVDAWPKRPAGESPPGGWRDGVGARRRAPARAARLLLVLGAPALLTCGGAESAPDSPPLGVEVVRFSHNPIIRPGMPGLTGADGANITGPSLISVPSWLPDALGRYYLYFAHDNGSYIRLAYADRLEGPWTIHAGGVLGLDETGFDDYVASPDVHIDEADRRIVMYYHGHRKDKPAGWRATRVAVSADGLRFRDHPQDLGVSHFRVFRWRGDYYAIAALGELYRAGNAADPWTRRWETGGYPFQYPGAPRGPVLRHPAVQLDGDTLTVYFSRSGDAPERIMRSTILLTDNWRSGGASEPVTVLEPVEPYEGADLRDPAVFREGGRTYLLYSVAGESGLAIADVSGLDVEVSRFPQNPIIRPGMPGLTGADGANINGPSLVAVPPWLPNALGRYYLYFADHNGSYIRLAYAAHLEGPWTIHVGGGLSLDDSEFDHHIASPDVHVDEAGRRIVMYYHGRRKDAPVTRQTTHVAVSEDGIQFREHSQDLGASYFRVFRWRGDVYALAVGGELYRARNPADPWTEMWETGVYPFRSEGTPRAPFRHAAVQLDGDTLTVYFSRVRDAPERIMRSTILLTDDWRSWRASDPVTLLEPAEPYEGADLPVEPSQGGAAPGRTRQLRDPAVFREGGRTYLL